MPNKKIRKNLVTDNPQNMTESMLNFAYAKNGKIHLSYANGTEDIDLCEYVSYLAEKQGCNLSANDVMEGSCIEGCDCEIAILYSVAIQAGELRERLKHYESLEEQGKLETLPCKVGENVYAIRKDTKVIYRCVVCEFIFEKHYDEVEKKCKVYNLDDNRFTYYDFSAFGTDVFFTYEDAEQKLKGGAENESERLSEPVEETR